MNGIVVDASVTLSWCFPDEQTNLSMGVLERLQAGEQARVPAFWALEVLNTLLLGERKGRITAEQTATFLDALKSLNPALDFATLAQVAGPVQIICRDHRVTPYDALYIELAIRLGCPLATLDQPQREAAGALGRSLSLKPGCIPSDRELSPPAQPRAVPCPALARSR